MGIMIKVRDGLDGRINMDESFSKPLDYDTWWKLNKGAVLAEEILMKAGAKKEDVMQSASSRPIPGVPSESANCSTRIARPRFRTATAWTPRSFLNRGGCRQR